MELIDLKKKTKIKRKTTGKTRPKTKIKPTNTDTKSKGHFGKTLVVSTRQTGKTKNHDRDKDRKAMSPGRRLSRKGNIYYEHRKNRSDKTPLKTGE
jgi:hypothetical protein